MSAILECLSVARLSLIGGLSMTSLAAVSFGTTAWTERSGDFGNVDTGLWIFCHTPGKSITMCGVMSLGFSGAWAAVRVLMCCSLAAACGALFFNLKECIHESRQQERHVIACYFLTGLLLLASVLSFLVQDSLRPYAATAVWQALGSGFGCLALATGLLLCRRRRLARDAMVIAALDTNATSLSSLDSQSDRWRDGGHHETRSLVSEMSLSHARVQQWL